LLGKIEKLAFNKRLQQPFCVFVISQSLKNAKHFENVTAEEKKKGVDFQERCSLDSGL